MSTTNVRAHARVSKRGRLSAVQRHKRQIRAQERAEEKWEADHEEIGSLAYFSPYGMDVARVYANGTPSDFRVPAFKEFAGKVGYTHTDAWRGYHELPDRVGDWVRVLDTWVSPMGHSGDPETRHQVPIEALYKQWKAGARPPFPVMVSMLQTSNVFSMGFEMFVRSKDAPRMRELLAEAGVER